MAEEGKTNVGDVAREHYAIGVEITMLETEIEIYCKQRRRKIKELKLRMRALEHEPPDQMTMCL